VFTSLHLLDYYFPKFIKRKKKLITVNFASFILETGKSIARKRKRRFHGNRFSKNAQAADENNLEQTPTASTSKLASTLSSSDEVDNPLSGHRIFDISILSSVFSELFCPNCCADNIILCENQRYGLCSFYTLKCKSCDFAKTFASSKRTGKCPEVNTGFVYGMRQIGKGFQAAYKLCSTMNLPTLSKTAYVCHEQKLLNVVQNVAENSMIQAENAIFEKKTRM